jgi:hypothetical protein
MSAHERVIDRLERALAQLQRELQADGLSLAEVDVEAVKEHVELVLSALAAEGAYDEAVEYIQ